MKRKFHKYKKRLIPSRPLQVLIWGMIVGLSFSACKEAAPIPILGSYQGISETITWEFVEILNNDGNMIGIEEKRDTMIDQAGALLLTQVGKESAFTLDGTGSLSRISGFSSHEFSYDNQDEFTVVENTDGAETKRLEFEIDGSGTVTLFYLEQGADANMRPRGRKINFLGQAE